MIRWSRLIRWLPFAAFALYVLITVSLKDRSGGTAEIEIRPEAATNCTRLCSRLGKCALEVFGDTEFNRASLPQLKSNCFSGCVRQEARIMKCFQIDAPCANQVRCVVHFLQHDE